MTKPKSNGPLKFTPNEILFFKRLNDRTSITAEYRRIFNITVLICVTLGIVFLSTVI
ncbi:MULTISPECIES: hypothetical protein [Desulfococcus]|uniref:Uncharacterized protein n=1 Tax=Desulfococcus multivorans DSM 2059 TaxID=1121405 RepID=S7V3D2_DESML|nr:hypothetical protein [Desulfococcus multivorans]EPR39168.1 hypothetical protein dsmv_2824 [Desulfococcus multivorans DSM 2059]MDX9818105.1 hypothetical protein [Desulfococcus multivorans]SJZ53343.1 hypothetical protein SAMN02745446_00849 [Desulfococcus multivorans DSM 2059]